MTQDIVSRVKTQLNNEFYFMNDNWLNDCVEYFVTERNSSGHTGEANIKETADFVRGQYLLADLREINTRRGTLPQNLANNKLTILPGSYMLQVNEMVDISRAKYKQLQVIRKARLLNSQQTEEDNNQENSANVIQVAKRMMSLKLTDGVQNIVGMEYTHIPLLNGMFYPGCKVLIKGPVKCRNGVLFLQEANIEGKGGEVDSLLVPNAMENILARAVNKAEDPDPFYVNIEVKKEKPKAKKSQVKETKAQVVTKVVTKVQDPDVNALFEDDDFDIDLDEIVNIEASHMQNENNVNTRTTMQPVQSTQGSSATNASVTTASTSANRSSTVQAVKTSGCRENWENCTNEEQRKSIINAKAEKEQRLDKLLSKESSKYEEREFPSDEDWGLLETTEPCEEDDDMNRILEAELESIEKKRLKTDQRIDDRVWSPFVTEPDGEDNDAFLVCNKIGLSNLSVEDSGHSSTDDKWSVSKRNSKLSDTNTSTEKASQSSKSQKEDSSTKRSKQHSSLCDVLSMKTTRAKTIEIRARISKMGLLTTEKHSWVFNCTISDGTASMDVTFPNKLLENIIGASAKESLQKGKKKSDPEIDQQLKTLMRRAEGTLQALDILKIRVKEGKKPEVVDVS